MKNTHEKCYKNDAYCHFRHVIGSTTRWTILFFIIFLSIISMLFLRLKQAPIDLNIYKAHIEDMISSEGLKITLKNPTLTLDESKAFAPQIKAEKLYITLNESHYNFENISLNFSDTAILKLNFRPHSITAEKTNLLTSLSGQNNNNFSLKNLYKQQFKTGFLSHLDHLRISKTSFSLMGDKTYFKTVKLHNGTLELKHNADLETLTLRALGKIETDYFTQNAALETVYKKSNGLVTTGINLQNIDATSYNILGFSGKADVKIRISQDDKLGLLGATLQAKSSGGKFNFENSKDYPDISVKKMNISAQYYLRDKKMTLQIHNLTTNKGYAKGSIIAQQHSDNQISFAFLGKLHGFNYAGLFEHPVTFENMHLEGAFNKKEKKANLSKIQITAEKAKFTGTAQFTEKQKGEFNIATHLKIENITEKNLTKVWPVKTPGQARYWLKENLERANMTGGTLHVVYKSTDAFPKINLRLPYSNCDFYYRKPMPPARDTSGIMTLRNKKLRFDMKSGTINNIDITKGYFEIPNIVAKIPLGKTQLFLDGRTSDLLYILDQKPLNIMTPRNILYAHKKGRFSGDVTFELPLLSTVTFDDVKVSGNVTVKNGSVSLQKDKYNITNYNGDIAFTEKGLQSDFTADINTVTASGNWKESFEKSAPISTDITATGLVTDQNLLKFGINITDYWKGSAKTDFKLQLSNGSISHISAISDASSSTFMIPYSTFTDPQGNKKSVRLKGKEIGGALVLDHIIIKSPETDLTIKNLRAKKGLRAFDIASLTAGDIVKNTTGKYRHIIGKRPTLRINAETLDAEQFINYDPMRPAISQEPLPWTLIKADISSKSVRINKKKTIKNLQIYAASPHGKPDEMGISAKINESGNITATLKTLSNSKKSFTLTAENAGAFLNAYDSFYYYKNGKLDASGTIVKKYQGVPATITGRANIIGGAAENAPTVAKIFSVASMTGITDRLGKGNLSMDKIEADFVKKGHDITLSNGSIAGSAIGVSFKGHYNSDTGQTDLSGTFVPLYGLNNFVSHIPILGDILTSRKGEGIIGLTYTMEGTFAKPDISVNPLSALTPGILRRIFE